MSELARWTKSFLVLPLLMLMIGGSASVQAKESAGKTAFVFRSKDFFLGLDEALKTAQAMYDRGEYQEAISLSDKNIELIGDAYFMEGVEDDTGMNLSLSEYERRRGVLNVSAAVKIRVLAGRTHQLKKKPCVAKKPRK